MKIRLVSFSDQGGAGIAALRITRALHAEGTDVRLLLAEKRSDEDLAITLKADSISQQWIIRRIRRWRATARLRQVRASRSVEHNVFSHTWGDHDQNLINALSDADIVHFHWIAGMFDPLRVFSKLPTRCRVFWTLHDMNPITGGYHYQRLLEPEEGFSPPERNALERKQRAVHRLRGRLTCCAPSQWLLDLASQSKVFKSHPVQVLRNCTDPINYFPFDTQIARRFLGLEPELPVLLFINHNHNDPNKGLPLLLETLKLLRSKGHKFQVLTVGRNGQSAPGILHLGTIESPLLLARAYSAATVFVIPSALDNYPNTLVESFSCGTPAVGFRVGGIPELILDGQTGSLAENRSPQALAHALIPYIDGTADLPALSARCLAFSRKHHTPSVVARAHLAAYAKALG
jgi:glycosyltransferase involved in cell wall biosynthesis